MSPVGTRKFTGSAIWVCLAKQVILRVNRSSEFLPHYSVIRWWTSQMVLIDGPPDYRGASPMRKILLVFSVLLLVTAEASAQDPGWIGVTIRDGREAGVEVRAVEPDSPAERAGVQAGDRIVAFDAMPVVGVRQLTRIITETPVGHTVSLTLVRDGEERTLQVTPASRPSRFPFGIPSRLPDLSDLV